jgi:hypothetical protein
VPANIPRLPPSKFLFYHSLKSPSHLI